MSRSGPVIVFWDGQCPFCAAVATRMLRFDTEHALRLVDYHDAGIAATAWPRFTAADLDREMHAYLPDGTWRIGYFAWAVVLKRLPKWRLLGRIMELPVFADAGPKAYRWFANRRLLVSKLLGLPAPCPTDGSCRLPA
jgi:predicted DCC family thiol-disulfide oxidoreductase YuxK